MRAEATTAVAAAQNTLTAVRARPEGVATVVMSDGQERMWFLNRVAGATAEYNLPLAFRVEGELDLEALSASLREVSQRHESLRTNLRIDGSTPVQTIADRTPSIEYSDVSARPCDDPEREAARLRAELTRRPFALERDSLFRVSVIRVRDHEHWLTLILHHAISDGWSLGILMDELAALYDAHVRGTACVLSELPVQYADYAVWQRHWLAAGGAASALDYWKRHLRGAPVRTRLPWDYQRPQVRSSEGARCRFALSRELSETVRRFLREERLTLFALLLAAWQLLLHRYSRQSDIVVGTAVAGRNRAEVEGLIGFFVNTLALRTDLSGNPTFRELLRRVKHTTIEGIAHQDLPFGKLIEELNPPRSLSSHPLFQVTFAIEPEGAPREFGRARLTPDEVGLNLTKFDLNLVVRAGQAQLSGFIEYATDLFCADTIAQMSDHFQRVLELAIREPERRIADFDLGARTLAPCTPSLDNDVRDGQRTLSHIVAERAAATPSTPAVCAGDCRLTWAELDARVNRCVCLLSRYGVSSGTPVGVLIEPSTDLIVAMLAVMRVGAISVPVASEDPVERVECILSDAAVSLVITSGTAGKHPLAKRQRIDIDELGDDPGASLMPAAGDRGAIASVFYRSTAPGRPMGVPVTHRALLPLHFDKDVDVTPFDRVGVAFDLSRDIPAFWMLRALAAGACVVDITAASQLPPLRFGRFLREQQITVLVAPAGTVARLSRDFPRWLRDVRVLLSTDGRTPSSVSLVERAVRGRMFFPYGAANTGGPAVLFRDDQMGRPLVAAEARALLLDEALRQVPPGPTGELWLGGAMLAGRPGLELGADGGAGKGLVRTGDLIRLRADGSWVFGGRDDSRRIVSGQQCDLAEIESVLGSDPGVHAAAATVDDATQRIVAFVLVPDGTLDEAGLRARAEQWLPSSTVPSRIAAVGVLPRLSSGGLDRDALSIQAEMLAIAGDEVEFVAPRNDVEARVADIWSDVLRVDEVGVYDNFFALGGHSLLASQMIARVAALLGVDIPLRQIFDAPTIAGLAAYIDAHAATTRSSLPPLTVAPRGQAMKASYSQRRLWFLDRLVPRHAYNIPLAFRIVGAVDRDALQRAVHAVVQRHESLRTCFPSPGGEPEQHIASQVILTVEEDDLTALSVQAREEGVPRRVHEAAIEPFDLGRAPLARARLIRIDPAASVLVIVIHHAIMDAMSALVFVEELSESYRAAVEGTPANLLPVPFQYADFSAWQWRCLDAGAFDDQLAYWKGHLRGAGVITLPFDRPRPRVSTYAGAMARVTMGEEIMPRLKALSQSEHATLFMTLLAAFNVLLYRYSASADIIVGTPVTGRRHEGVERAIGFFLNTVALRVTLDPNQTFRDLLKQVREIVLDGFANQDIPFDRVIEQLAPARSLSHHSIFQVMFAFNASAPRALTLGDLEARPMAASTGTAKFDLLLALEDDGDSLHGVIEYSTDLFDRVTMERMSRHFSRLLAAIAANPEQSVSALPLMSDGERATIVHEWNRTGAPATPGLVHELFERHASATPDRIAIVEESLALSYAAVNQRANRLARGLRAFGIGTEDRVGICREASIEAMIAILAVLKAGAAYVPLDPAFPADRLGYMAGDARLSIVLTAPRWEGLFAACGVDTFGIEAIERQAEAFSSADLSIPVPSGSAAYVIYTSGSTGRPKGVVMPHGALANLIAWQEREHPEPLRTLQCAPLSFDVSFQEIFATWSTGATLVLSDAALKRDPAALIAHIAAHRIERLFAPFVLLQQLAECTAAAPRTLKRIVTAGEQLQATPGLRRWFQQLPDCVLTNQYGPTEAHVVTSFDLSGPPDAWSALPPLGRPIANLEIYVLDRSLEPVPIGAIGELYIGGAGLARGYHARAALTAERFVADRFSGRAGARLYRTGDLARFQHDGTIEFIGRADEQIKIRGYRIEPGEVEAALARLSGVKEAIVVARTYEDADRRLVAYVACGDAELQVASLKEQLAATLPAYMVPSAIVRVSAWPLTPSGKIDRASLPAPAAALETSAGSRRPATTVERTLGAIWADVLKIGEPGVDESFFDLGGHSLLVTRMIARAYQTFDVEIPVRAVFETPTIASLAAVVEAASKTRDGAHRRAGKLLVPLRSGGPGTPFFCVHPATGSALAYRRLADAVDAARPFYAIEAAPLAEGRAAPTIEQLASLYIEQIATIQPGGPYLLGGWSMGGLVAYEMGRQLRAGGTAVALVVLFDTSAPLVSGAGEERATRLQQMLQDASWIASLDAAHAPEASAPEGQLVAMLRAALAGDGGSVQRMAPDERASVANTFARNTLAMLRYQPPRSDIPIVLFQASTADNARSEQIAAEWLQFTSGKLTRVAVSGDHYTMFAPEHVAGLADRLRGFLQFAG